jgi:hypothetical protein
VALTHSADNGHTDSFQRSLGTVVSHRQPNLIGACVEQTGGPRIDDATRRALQNGHAVKGRLAR